jgi:hypothetical protein
MRLRLETIRFPYFLKRRRFQLKLLNVQFRISKISNDIRNHYVWIALIAMREYPGFYHKTLRLRLARLERRGIVVKANSAYASKMPPNPKRGIDTIFNHFRDKPARAYDCRMLISLVTIIQNVISLNKEATE